MRRDLGVDGSRPDPYHELHRIPAPGNGPARLSQYVAIQWRADPSEGLHQVRQALGPRHGIEVVMELPHSTFCRLTNVPPFQVQGLLDELRALSHVQQVASLRSFELARSLEDE